MTLEGITSQPCLVREDEALLNRETLQSAGPWNQRLPLGAFHWDR